MRLSAFLRRHALLLSLGLLSLSLHVSAIAWIDLRPARLADAGRSGLAVRLTQSAPVLVPASGPAPASASAPAPVPARAPVAAAAPMPSAPAAAPRVDAAPAAPADASPESVAQADSANPSSEHDAAPQRMPAQYRIALAKPVRIGYRLTRTQAGGAASDDGRAELAWDTDGSSYRLELDGVLGPLLSEGGLDDAGIAPGRAEERMGTGVAATVFDRQRGEIVAGLGARPAQLVAGSQDAASVLLQLAGMGSFDRGQVNGVMEFWVGGMAGARLERFEVQGEDTIETGIGPLATVRLARLPRPNAAPAPLLEVWLAPQQSWLPVQLRVTAPDGAVHTQTLESIERSAE